MADSMDEGEESPCERTVITSPRTAPKLKTSSSALRWKYPRRYLVALMAFFGFANLYALRVNLSVAVVAMTTNQTVIVNGTEVVVPAEFDWPPSIQGLVLSSFFYGYMVMQLPAGYLSAKYGGRRILGIGVCGTSILTLCTPIFANTSLYLLLTARVLEGLFQGVAYPSMYALWSRWAPPLERSKLASIAFCGSYFGTFVALPVSGFLAEFIGWPSIFVVFGSIAFIWSGFWCVTVSESPSEDKFISEEELQYIRSSIGSAATNTKIHLRVPWGRIFTSFPVWAIIVAHFCENWGFYTLLTELPTFMNDIFAFKLHNAGILAAAPYLIMGAILVVSGYAADQLRANENVSTVNVRKIFNTVGLLMQAIFLVIAAHVTSIAQLLTCLIIAVGFGGFAWSGFGINHLDIAPPYASILMGLSNTIATLPGMISPIVTGYMVEHKTHEEWQSVFYLAAAVHVFGALVYGLLASGDEQPWARMVTGLLSDDMDSDADEMNFQDNASD